LAYLRDLPIDELKLDRSFVTPMLGDPRAQALVSSTICLAHSLGLSMVAEGIEDGATYAMLTKLDCDEGQGYYMSKPLPAHEFEAWLSTRQIRRVPSVSGVPTQAGASMALRNKSVEAGEPSGPSRPAAT
jgi:EAL domain-containing protein (putative c-di-GMP-specific phosphodiesterase class I)